MATAARVLAQVRNDPRTVAMLVVVPAALLGLLVWLYGDQPATFDRVGPALLGVFPLVSMFLVTSVATLRERTSGTLERLMTLPVPKAAFVGGYAIAFGLLAMLQALVVSGLALTVYGMDAGGPVWAVVVVAVLAALLGTALGLFVSAFAASEFQAVQFMPAVVLPQLLVCGLLLPTSLMPRALEAVSSVLPMTYSVEAMALLARGGVTGEVVTDMLVVGCFVLAALGAGALTLRRRTA